MNKRTSDESGDPGTNRDRRIGSVLIVDDDPASLELARVILEAAGWEVHAASSGEEALALLERRVVPYVLTDVRMPGMSGVELARRVAERHRGLRLAAISAYPADVEEAVAAGVFEGVIEKPIDVEALAGTVDWLFFRRHLV